MAANWNNPALTSLYINFLAELKARDVDVLTMNPGTNIPVDSKRWNSATNTFQNWNGAAWVNLVISGAGGGTGSGSFPVLGTMASQNSNAIAVTGGTMAGVNLNANDITSGVLALSRGGLGVSLTLGPNGSYLNSNGSTLQFTFYGTNLIALNAAEVNVGKLPDSVLPVGGNWNITSPIGINLNSAYMQIYGGTGLLMGGAMGGALGPGSINASAYYLNGVPLTTATGIPSGMMAMFSGPCPVGWTHVSAAAGRTIRFMPDATGAIFAADTHNHGINGDVGGPSNANSGITSIPGFNAGMDSGSGVNAFLMNQGQQGSHAHSIDHTHTVNLPTSVTEGGFPARIEYNLCRKD